MKLFILAFIATTTFAQAAYYVECGKNFDEDAGTFKKVVFKASSESDVFSGRNGDIWSVALSGNWLPDGLARAREVVVSRTKSLEITISKGTGMSEIGKKYVVVNMFSENPTLNIYQVGGFAGGTKYESAQCFTSSM